MESYPSAPFFLILLQFRFIGSFPCSFLSFHTDAGCHQAVRQRSGHDPR